MWNSLTFHQTLTRLNAVSTFGLMGFMLQYVEGMFISFHHLFISSLMKGKRLLLPSEKESNQPTVSCQFLTFWNIKSKEMFPSLEVVTWRDVGFRIYIPSCLFLNHTTGKKQGRIKVTWAPGLQLFQGLSATSSGTVSSQHLLLPFCNISHA